MISEDLERYAAALRAQGQDEASIAEQVVAAGRLLAMEARLQEISVVIAAGYLAQLERHQILKELRKAGVEWSKLQKIEVDALRENSAPTIRQSWAEPPPQRWYDKPEYSKYSVPEDESPVAVEL